MTRGPRCAVNPVVGRELTERLRGLRAFVALSIFVSVLALTAFLVFEGSGAATRRSTSPPAPASAGWSSRP